MVLCPKMLKPAPSGLAQERGAGCGSLGTKVHSHSTWTLWPSCLRSVPGWRCHLSGSSPVLFPYTEAMGLGRSKVKGRASGISTALYLSLDSAVF